MGRTRETRMTEIQPQAAGKAAGDALRLISQPGAVPPAVGVSLGCLFPFLPWKGATRHVENLRVPGRQGRIIENDSVKQACLENGVMILVTFCCGEDIISAIKSLFKAFIDNDTYETYVKEVLEVRLSKENTS